jgi:hypothetical protein
LGFAAVARLAVLLLDPARAAVFVAVRFVVPAAARPFFVAGFVVLRVELFADFVAALRFGADFNFFAAAVAGARFLAVTVFAFVRRLAGWLLVRFLRAAITAPDTAPITEPTIGVPTTVPTTAPATAPPRVLVAAPFSSLDRMSFLSSSVMVDLQMWDERKLTILHSVAQTVTELRLSALNMGLPLLQAPG